MVVSKFMPSLLFTILNPSLKYSGKRCDYTAYALWRQSCDLHLGDGLENQETSSALGLWNHVRKHFQ